MWGTNSTDAGVMVQIPGTSLYKGTFTSGEAMAFLVWDTDGLPKSLNTVQTWADVGQPAYPGYYLFLNTMPPDSAAPAFESALRETLTAPGATGFVWVLYHMLAKPEVQTVIPTGLAPNNKPVVAGKVSMQLPTGMQTLGFDVGTPVIASRESEEINSFVMHYPPVPGSDPPWGLGVAVDIASGRVGCLRFDGLVNAGTAESGVDRALKLLVHVQIDPIRPFDPNRTYQIFTGAAYFLEATDGGYRLIPAY